MQAAARAGNSARMMLDVYAHVLVGGAVPVATLIGLLGRGGDDAVVTAAVPLPRGANI
ncbi:MAG TPA: hypothetical protein VGP69_03145 [Gaiellaceae bacterium]|nr:hypothetical protein [Gaiellaceae bacterium]